jgi:hypothetical protein
MVACVMLGFVTPGVPRMAIESRGRQRPVYETRDPVMLLVPGVQAPSDGAEDSGISGDTGGTPAPAQPVVHITVRRDGGREEKPGRV